MVISQGQFTHDVVGLSLIRRQTFRTSNCCSLLTAAYVAADQGVHFLGQQGPPAIRPGRHTHALLLLLSLLCLLLLLLLLLLPTTLLLLLLPLHLIRYPLRGCCRQ
jgi:hypothetical protein